MKLGRKKTPPKAAIEAGSSAKKGAKSLDSQTGADQKLTAVRGPCRIVAIGASAGGLEPFELFFENMRADTGFAFVVIQHLSPDFRSMMDELLNRHSAMKIRRVEHGMAIEPNTIYLNPPRVDMEVAGGKFFVKAVESRNTLHLPINVFMESLAKEQGGDSVAIILSGTGSDGTLGSTAIRQAGGTVLVQDPGTAKFDGMPLSVLETLDADAIAPPKKLAELVSRLAGGEAIGQLPVPEESEPKDRVFQLLRERFGTDFSHYKDATIERRLTRRAELLGLPNLDDYLKKLEGDEDEAEALYADFLIEVTEFFRDPEAFEALQKQVIPRLIESMSGERVVRVWIPGCASGEEAYSLAIGLSEEARKKGVEPHLKLLATDIHHRSLEAANHGVYSASAVSKLPDEVIERYFERVGSTFQIRPFIRQMVVFSVHNILRDPPFTKIDLVSCRNLLIYLNDTAQQKALAFFHFALVKGGHLFLGPSETVGDLSSEFELIDQRWRIFAKRRNVRLIESMTQLPRNERGNRIHDAPIVTLGGDTTLVRSDAKRVYEKSLDIVLRKYAPPGFLLKRSGEIVRVFGDAGRFIEVGEGNFSQSLESLVRVDLRVVVSAALDRAKTPQALPFERKVRLRGDDGKQSMVTIVLEPVSERRNETDLLLLTINEEARNVLIPNFDELEVEVEDLETVTLLRQRIEDLEHELQGSEETLQTTIEELETSNEELQATNEELMASNEELQSTNEELHSVNEELYTVSAEHQRKIIELTEMSGDMEHLLQATGIGTIFVDSGLNVRRFTPAAVQAFNILHQDVGRPISHITNRFGDSDLTATLSEVVSSGEPIEKEIRLGDQVMLFRALPYMASPGVVSGAVLTTVDVTDLKSAQTAAQQLASRYESIVQDIGHFMLRWSSDDQKITFCNDAYVDLVGQPREQVLGRKVQSIIPLKENQEFIARVSQLEPGNAERFLLNVSEAGDRPRWFEGAVRAIANQDGVVTEYQAVGEDISSSTAYRIALEKLSQLSLDNEKPYADSLAEALKIGAEFFDMPLGIFSRIEEQDYIIESVVGGSMFRITAGTVQDLGKTFCGDLSTRQKPLAIEHVSESEHEKSDAYHATGYESYIGQRIFVESKLYGAVSFASRKPHPVGFDDISISFVGVLAEWIGHRVERQRLVSDIERYRDDQRLILDNIRAKVLFKDDKNKIIKLNSVAAKAMGITVEAGTGADTSDLFPEMAKKYHKDDLSVIESGKPKLGIVEQFTPKNAPSSWVLTDRIPYDDGDDDNRKLLVVSTDITHEKEQEKRINDLNQELLIKNDRLETNDSLKQFAHVASHDLQEPLRKLMQFSEYLLDDCGDDLSEDGKYFVQVISRSSERMRHLVMSLLSLSGATGNEMNAEEVDLDEVVRELQSELDVSVTEAKAALTIEGLPKVTGDATLVSQLFRNLLTNAIKYRRPGVSPKITITSSPTLGGGCDITVADNGIGMDSGNVDRIFEPFTRLHDRQEYDGTGIGLAICRTVCERHGWNIRVESAIGEGTTFIIRIPENVASPV